MSDTDTGTVGGDQPDDGGTEAETGLAPDHTFALAHLDQPEYNYHFHDGSRVRVKFEQDDGFANGDRVSVYHYDDSGTRLAYHRFRVAGVDDKRIHHQSGNTDDVPDAMLYALRSGGWTVTNVADPHDHGFNEPLPPAVQWLDVRDACRAFIDENEVSGLHDIYELVARLAEEVAVYDVYLDADVALTERSKQESHDRAIARAGEKIDDGDYGDADVVKGIFATAVGKGTFNHLALANELSSGERGVARKMRDTNVERLADEVETTEEVRAAVREGVPYEKALAWAFPEYVDRTPGPDTDADADS